MKTLRIISIVCLLALASSIYAQGRPDSEILAELLKRVQPTTGVIVAVRQGVVTLTGTVSSLAQKNNLATLARRTVGVTRVDDRIRVVPAQRRTDEQIRDAVRQSFSGNLRREEISAVTVAVQNGVVTLTGTLQTSYPKQVAGVLASWVPGVVDVRNQIVVRPAEARADAEIQAEVQRRYQQNPFIPTAKITLSVRNGIVTLIGTVDNYLAADQAEAIARFVPGVVEVNNQLFVRTAGVQPVVR